MNSTWERRSETTAAWRYETQPWEKQAKDVLRPPGAGRPSTRLVAYSAEIVLVWARNERFDHVGTQWPSLPPAPLDNQLDMLTGDLDGAQEAAVKVALAGRWDLMNARAQVVDAWRQLAVTANALLGVLNVQYHLDSLTPPTGTNPLAFATSRTNQQLILNGQLPLVRVVERNNYRTALITYQRARRSLMALEDNIAAQVRFDVRQLHLFAENYKIQQKVIESLYSQVENALELIAAPADPAQLNQSGTSGQANAAALTNQYLTALKSLNSAQTQMYDIWLSFLATRMELYQDLERLPLDNRGVWIDEPGNPADLSRCPVGSADNGSALPVPERGAALRRAHLAEPRTPLPPAARGRGVNGERSDVRGLGLLARRLAWSNGRPCPPRRRMPFAGARWFVKQTRGDHRRARNLRKSDDPANIVCNVRSGTKGSTNATTIKWLMDNGAEVKKGDTVIVLDDSGLQEALKSQNITVDNAKADLVKADEQYPRDPVGI